MKVCLVTTGQPSTNPRLVKEADALEERGYDVHVVAAHWVDWATEMDRELLASRQWKMTLVDWRRERSPLLFHYTRARHWAARKAARLSPMARHVTVSALARAGPELQSAAVSIPADLYIAHNLGALPAAFAAASVHSARVGFDAEDFHSGQLSYATQAREVSFTRDVERRFLGRTAYVTAAAPGIAEAYRDLCGIRLPTCILNVFPLRHRPHQFRPDANGKPVRLYWFSQTIGPGRGLEDAVRAIGLLGEDSVELHLQGRWAPGYESCLRQIASESGMDQHRVVSHDPAMADEMVRLASGYDVGLAIEPRSSLNNDVALSNKIFTYLLAGNAVAATRTAGQSRLMPQLQGAAAWYEPGKPESLAAVLKPWLKQRDALLAARETAWRLGEARFNWDLEKRTFLDVIAGVLDRAACPLPLR